MKIYNGRSESMLEVKLKALDDFLKVRETLTRIGVSRKEKKLFQSCHILHKQGRYFIVHFKELFALDGKSANISDNDIERRNTIAQLLSDWNLVEVVSAIGNKAILSQIKVIAFKDKHEWNLETKYNIGKKKEDEQSNESIKFRDFIKEDKDTENIQVSILTNKITKNPVVFGNILKGVCDKLKIECHLISI